MHIETIKEKLLDAVYKAEKITGRNMALQILSNLAIEVSGSQFKIKATNLDLGLEIIVPVKVKSPGKITVSALILSNFLANLPVETKIDIQSKENDVFIHTSKTSTKIKNQNFSDFPLIPKLEGKKFKIEANSIVKGLKSVVFSAATSSIKPELSSINIYHDGESLVFVATDSFRLAEKRIKTTKAKEISQILIPFKNTTDIIRILESVNGELDLTISQNQISFKTDEIYLDSRVIEGNFPDYKQIIPKETKTEVTLLKADLLSALKLSNVFSDSFNHVVLKVIPDEKLFELTTKNSDVGENHYTLDSVMKGDEITLGFNHKYIADCLNSIDSDSITLSFVGPGKPVMIKGVSDKSFLYIVMPMNR